MKFTSEDLMKVMGLQVGDRVRVDTFDYSDFEVREAYDMGHKEIVLADDNEEMFGLTLAFGYEYEILPRLKRVGDLKCKEDCDNCPLKVVCAIGIYNNDWSYYDILEDTKIKDRDPEIYDLLKARLDKEVLEDE